MNNATTIKRKDKMKEYSVWLEDSDQITDYFVTKERALEIKKYWKLLGYKTTIVKEGK
jgi:hypothetical protein